MNKTDDLTKVLLDEKSYDILKSTAEVPKTTKEISKELNIPTSNLYYTINKLTQLDTLRIVDKQIIGNMVEHKYSSNHIFNSPLLINNESSKKDFEFFLQLYILTQKKALKAIDEDFASESKKDTTKLLIKDITLNENDWNQLQDLIHNFLDSINNDDGDTSIQISMSATIDK